MAEPSPGYEEFLASLNAPRTDRRYADDFALGALPHMSEAEREKVESLLLERLAADPSDDRLAPALAALGSERAIEPLRRALQRVPAITRVRAALALSELDPGFDPVTEYLAVLTSKAESGAREIAAVALGRQPSDAARDALLAILDDDSPRVRATAFGGLVKSLGLDQWRDPRYSLLREISHLLTSDLMAVRAHAAQRMRHIVAAVRAGKTAAELGLDATSGTLDVLDAIMQTVRSPGGGDPDAKEVARLDDRGRQLLESLLLAELPRDNPKVPRLLARIGTDRAVAPLKEAQWQTLPKSGEDVTKALEGLRKRGA